MARATRAAPPAATRVGGTTIAPAASAVLVTAIGLAIALSLVVGGADRAARPDRLVAAAIAVGRAAAGAPIHGFQATNRSGRGSAIGVPNVPWLADRGDGVWLYGRGATARALPVGEFGLAVDERYVATSTPGADGRSTIHLRATATGAHVRDLPAPIWVSAAAWTPDGLVITGYRDASMTADGGLILVAPIGSTKTLVPAGPFSSVLGRPVARGDVVVSPSRRVVASNVCGATLCDSQVVDVATGATFRPARAAQGFLRAVTEDAVITTDDEARWITARDFRDGREKWRLADSVLLDPIATTDGSLVGVVGSAATGWGVDRVDPRGGARRLTPRVHGDATWPRIWRPLSSPASVVVGPASFDEAVGAAGASDIEVIGTGPADPPGSATAPGRFVLSIVSEAAR